MVVSAKRFIHDEPGLFKASVAFVERFAKVPDPVMLVAKKAATINGKIAWVLLGTTLFQECSFSEISALLNALYEKFPDDMLWNLPVPKDDQIEECVKSVFAGRSWSVAEHASGIVWSVGHFVRRHEDLLGWLQSRTPMEMWRDLGEIYFMGKGNPRPKACAAIYRLIGPAPVGLGLCAAPVAATGHGSATAPEKFPPLPLTMGGRRFLAILGPGKNEKFSELDSRAKQRMANEFYAALVAEQSSQSAQSLPSAQSLTPAQPYVAAHALQFFLEEGKEGFICRTITENCRTCPLYEFCNYAERHDR